MLQPTELWETYRQQLGPESLGYVECQPDLHVTDLPELTADMLAGLGVKHILLDRDGTMTTNQIPMTAKNLQHLQTIATDSRFESFNIATDSLWPIIDTEAHAIGPDVKVFRPYASSGHVEDFFTKSHPAFYKRILFEKLDMFDNPERVVMIGDSPKYDVAVPQSIGMRTVLVDRLERRRSQSFTALLAGIQAVHEAAKTDSAI